jgi:hypothetical protein
LDLIVAMNEGTQPLDAADDAAQRVCVVLDFVLQIRTTDVQRCAVSFKAPSLSLHTLKVRARLRFKVAVLPAPNSDIQGIPKGIDRANPEKAFHLSLLNVAVGLR